VPRLMSSEMAIVKTISLANDKKRLKLGCLVALSVTDFFPSRVFDVTFST